MQNLENWYFKSCKFLSKHFIWIAGDISVFAKKCEETAGQKYRDAIIFTGIDIEPFESTLLSYAGTVITLLLLLLLNLTLFQITTYSSTVLILISLITITLPCTVFVYLNNYIIIHSEFMKIRSLGDIPEVLSYIVMSMKMVPNMEHSILFAATNSNRPLAHDLKKVLWSLHVRVYSSMDDAVIEFSEIWGKNSEYFKRALHLIKSSTNEKDEAQRIIVLNRALDVVLDGTKNIMEVFASRLKTPTYILYSIFILIPLALVALLPAVTVVGWRFNIVTLILFYNILLPMATFVYGEYILMQRPAAFLPQRIPETHPKLENIQSKKIIALVIATIIGAFTGLSGYLWIGLGNPGGIVSTSTMEGIIPPTVPVLWGLVFSFSLYLHIVYSPYKQIRDNIQKMEHEFADSLFILGRRISEGRSAEESFAHISKTMKGSAIASTFDTISSNIMSLRTDIKAAMFDEDFGAFKDIHSDRINTTMKLFAEIVQKSHISAGTAVIKLADHLKQLQEVERNIKRSLYDITSTMRSTITVFAPLIGGVTIALSEIIAAILHNVAESMARLPQNMIPGPAQIDPSNLNQSIPTDLFTLTIGLYLIMIAAILTRFSGTIEYGGDKYQLMYDLSRMLPVSLVVFSISTIFSRIIFGNLI